MPYFNSMKVRLIQALQKWKEISISFQFHEGSINTLVVQVLVCLILISIP